MQVTRKNISDVNISLTISADSNELAEYKASVLKKFAPKVKIAGFREGKAPLELVEKHTDPNQLQTELIDYALNILYGNALDKENIRPVGQPKVELTKFVPYTNLEFKAEVPVVGKIILPDFKDIKVKKEEVKITKKDIDEVLNRLLTQLAEYKIVDRTAKNGDRAYIDFEGTDDKGKPVGGAKGSDYPLALGSNTFIPGFEDNVVGLKTGQEKTFTIPFPKDYGVKGLQGKKVTFKIKLNKLEETIKAELNDAFAKKVGPFNNFAELKADVQKQLIAERQNQANHKYEEALVKELVKKSKLSLPESLIDEQIAAVDKEFRQNLTYRGETFNEYLENTAQTEEQYRNNELKPAAEERVKAGLVLSEIAEQEKITVSPEELDIRMQVLKGQYTDPKMQEELEKPESRRDIAARLLTEKTINKIISKTK